MLQFFGFFNSFSESFNAEVSVIQKVEYVVIIKKGVNSYQLVLQLFGRHDWWQGLKGDFGFRKGLLKLIDPLFYPSARVLGQGTPGHLPPEAGSGSSLSTSWAQAFIQQHEGLSSRLN